MSRRPQFTLRSLLVAMLVVAALLTWHTSGIFLIVAAQLFLFWGMPFMPAIIRRRP